ncbi:MAG: histidine--tRNA ligase [Oscillospiraceae bacterium]|nr:histidine--tRNA ligase [Candidatus Limimonas egerieequi]
MALLTSAIKGTEDILPSESYKNRFVEATLADIAGNFGFREIRTPVFEHTELFNRSVGDTTDVVQKEMYTFEDKGGRSITLRPEGTAGAVRAFLEHGLFNDALPQKVYYFTSCYRYEKPQAGRLREFHQFGVECFGADSAAADAEVISLASEIFGFLGIEGLELQINSIGCPTCRAKFQEALKEYFESKKDQLCETCLSRLDRNPMRILDCKSPVCSEIAKDAPVVLDYLCDDCSAHFESLKKYLEAMSIPYKVNPTIVRGLDYYTKTVFEFVATGIGAQGTVCGGGRYDGLCEELGGNHVPALGFGLGLERLMLVLEQQGIELPEEQKCNLYVAPAGEAAALYAAGLVTNLRQEGVFALFDVSNRGIKAQMKYANKIGAEYVVVIGDDELSTGVARLKNMDSGEETEVKLDTLAEDFVEISIRQSVANLDLGEDLENVDVSGIDFNSLFGGKL